MNCVFCGSAKATEKVIFPPTFTAYQLLQAGDHACKRCAEMFRDAKFRRNCYVVSNGKFLVIDDPLQFLIDLYQVPTPFVLYLTRQKRKHGWIIAVQNPVLGIDKFVLVVDEAKILFERQRFSELLSFSREILGRDVPKSILLCGMPNPSSLRKFGLSWREAVRLRDLAGNQLWEMCVKFGKSKPREKPKQKFKSKRT